MEGLIFSEHMTDTFTAQIIKFYREPKILQVKKYAHWLSMPTQREEFFEPLHRMRAIVGNIAAAKAAAFPTNCWHRIFKAFKLPSPCSNGQAERGAQRDVKTKLLRLFDGAGYDQDARTTMLAEAGHRSGLTIRQAWAQASKEYPELPHGRDAVNLYIGCAHTTGETERFLKVLAEQNDGTRGLQDADTLNDILQVSRHAPPVEDLSVKVANAQSVHAKGATRRAFAVSTKASTVTASAFSRRESPGGTRA